MTELTKAEQLAEQCDNFGDAIETLNLSEVSRELRRLSPMEAQLNDERELVNRGTALLLKMTDRCDRAYLEKAALLAANKDCILHFDLAMTRVKKLEMALRLIASCEVKFDGDVVSIATKALGENNA